MIQNFKQYNENLTDKMTPKSEEDVKKAITSYTKKIKNALKAKNEEEGLIEEYVDINGVMNNVMKIKGLNDKEFLLLLIENDIISLQGIYESFLENIAYDDDLHEEAILKILNLLNDN